MGAILSGIGSIASTGSTLATGATNLVGNIASSAVSAIGHVAQVGLGVLKVAGTFLVGAVGAFVGALTLASKASLDLSKNILSIKASTGMGFGAASRTAMNFGAYGVSSGELAGLLESVSMIPQFFKARAGAFGLGGYDSKDFIPDLAREFQKLGPIIGRGMLAALGMDTPSIRRLAATSPEKLQAQQKFSTGIQGSLGVRPGDIQNWAEDFTLLMSRVGQFVDLIKYRFASEMLPFLTTALERTTEWLGRNSEKVSSLIKNGVSWLFETLPGLVITAVNTVGNFASSVLRTLANSDSGLNKWVNNVLVVVDILANGLISLANVIQGIGKNIHATIGILIGATIGAIVGSLGGAVGAIVLAAFGGAIGGAIGQGLDDKTKKAKPITFRSNLAGAHGDSLEGSGSKYLIEKADSIDEGLQSFNSGVSSLIGETNKKMDAQGRDIKGIRAATEKTAGDRGTSSYNATIERFESYISEDAWALANR